MEEQEKKIDAMHKAYQTMTESQHLQKKFLLIAFNKSRPLGKLLETEPSSAVDIEKDNKRIMAEYFRMMSKKLDPLLDAQRNHIQITYPMGDKSAGLAECQRDQPSGTVQIKHTSPTKESTTVTERQGKPRQLIQRKKCIIIEDEIKSLLCWKTYQMKKHAPFEDQCHAIAGNAFK
jgi:hypothetical protein